MYDNGHLTFIKISFYTFKYTPYTYIYQSPSFEYTYFDIYINTNRAPNINKEKR